MTKYDHPSVVPLEEISGRLTGAGFALTTLLWIMAWVERTTAATAGSISAGVLKSQSGKGQCTGSIRLVGVNCRALNLNFDQ